MTNAIPKRSTTRITRFETEQLVICSLDFAAVISSVWNICATPSGICWWSTKAHHLVWSIDAPSREYMAIEQLAERVPGRAAADRHAEQLGMESHFAVCACSIRTASMISHSLSKNRKTTALSPMRWPCCWQAISSATTN
ncbi:ATP-dependent helicase HepA [Salmonella enterica subsp. arizonae]|uniref:ATP-dependent helicase HepA n=1 Tax=Salmonella enterica subsp. arizonae TaxID=59203 RepID=A0A2X4TIR8_SALER|nr:ATP-dependent helicase HepA [Salmonella enterica subsp. arizonae]